MAKLAHDGREARCPTPHAARLMNRRDRRATKGQTGHWHLPAIISSPSEDVLCVCPAQGGYISPRLLFESG